jgi:hypothetical protein
VCHVQAYVIVYVRERASSWPMSRVPDHNLWLFPQTAAGDSIIVPLHHGYAGVLRVDVVPCVVRAGFRFDEALIPAIAPKHLSAARDRDLRPSADTASTPATWCGPHANGR